MRFSSYFLPTLREAPSGAHAISHRLMLRAGLIDQIASGIYAWLPLGLRSLKKVSDVVRDEQEKAGGSEVMMPTIQPAQLWKKSGRYDDYGKELLRFRDRHDAELLYGPTGEEVLTDLFQRHVRSYRDLPKRLFQLQWKFRDEIRPRFGVMRAREFIMKDLYSFDLDKAGALRSYDAVLQSYYRAFQRIGLKVIAVRADTGPIGGDLSHEFHVVASTGESTIYYDKALEGIPSLSLNEIGDYYAAEEAQHDPKTCTVPEADLRVATGIEVGHVFYFGTKYSQPLGAFVTDQEGKQVPVEMGSYGIGLSRLVAALIEVYHDERGIIWPESVAPYKIGLINLKAQDAVCVAQADSLYAALREQKVEVFYDDRDESPGTKFADMDLVGFPYQFIVGPKEAGAQRVEVKQRATGRVVILDVQVALDHAVRGALRTLFPEV